MIAWGPVEADLTLIYYTANRIADRFASAVRRALDDVQGAAPIVAITQRPIVWDRAHHVTPVGLREPSIYNVYRQILIGAQVAKTPYVACCEDDTVYSASHFTYRPAPDVFAYDRNRWVLTRRLSSDSKRREAVYYWRERHQMAMCIAPRALLIETLEERFAQYPEPVPHAMAKRSGWGEPGRYEKNLGLMPRRLEYYDAIEPSVTFNHVDSLMGRRRLQLSDRTCDDVAPWGPADHLWRRIYGE